MPTAVRAEWARVGSVDAVRLVGWSADELVAFTSERGPTFDQLLRVLPGGVVTTADDFPATTAMPGTWTSSARDVTFVPRYPFLGGRSYAVLVRATTVDDFELLALPERIDPPAVPTTTVVAIHPSAGLVPRNLLRCYVEFSAPMSEGEAATCVRVVDDATREDLLGALLDMDPELWDPERRRLTVLFDPARIKRGLLPHDEAGYPLTEGRSVRIIVDHRFRDARGTPLRNEVSRTYRVGADVRRRVDPLAWELAVPAAGGRAPLVVTFDRPLDHALVARCITIFVGSTGSSHRTVRGAASVGPHACSWSFTPDAPWTTAPHHLTAQTILEDVAGNSVARVFDRDLDDPAHDVVDSDSVSVAFTPR